LIDIQTETEEILTNWITTGDQLIQTIEKITEKTAITEIMTEDINSNQDSG